MFDLYAIPYKTIAYELYAGNTLVETKTKIPNDTDCYFDTVPISGTIYTVRAAVVEQFDNLVLLYSKPLAVIENDSTSLQISNVTRVSDGAVMRAYVSFNPTSSNDVYPSPDKAVYSSYQGKISYEVKDKSTGNVVYTLDNTYLTQFTELNGSFTANKEYILTCTAYVKRSISGLSFTSYIKYTATYDIPVYTA